MKSYWKSIVVSYFFSCVSLSATCHEAMPDQAQETKLYFDAAELEVADKTIYLHFEDNLIETSVLRADQNGLYIFERDIVDQSKERKEEWKCPYCFMWWPLGEKCGNDKCPTNRW